MIDIVVGEGNETDGIVPEAYHQEDTHEGHIPGDDQDVDMLEEPCMIALLIVSNTHL